jgi:NAD(P)-dependent dehydrogenase (short-subunit alcohol dehydrogenase family)
MFASVAHAVRLARTRHAGARPFKYLKFGVISDSTRDCREIENSVFAGLLLHGGISATTCSGMTHTNTASSLPAAPIATALVTGGSRGLGRAMVLHLADAGIDTIFSYRTRIDDADAVVAEVARRGRRAVALPLDVTSSASMSTFVEEVQRVLPTLSATGTLDAVVNNAGVGGGAPIATVTSAWLDEMFQVHFKSVVLLTQQLLPHLADGGRIVNVSSGLARFSMPGYAAYASMKGAIEVFTRYLALELGPRRITANVLAPGAIETDFGGGHVRDNQQLNAMIAAQTALGRVGLPDDVGGALRLLLSADARFINGQRLEVSGGIHL